MSPTVADKRRGTKGHGDALERGCAVCSDKIAVRNKEGRDKWGGVPDGDETKGGCQEALQERWYKWRGTGQVVWPRLPNRAVIVATRGSHSLDRDLAVLDSYP